ncbi:MAG TPA: c-type cytochrome [Kofleriaceae bacterium]|nr:c-type cytochrome [Kofleriaceae bacterium]
MRDLYVTAALVGAVLLGAALVTRPAAVSAGPGKNLEVYPKNTELSVIKKDMKVVAKALGVQCDYCHDLDAMDADSEKKEAARGMMRMTAAANAKLKKDGFKAEVSCVTCHRGEKEPKKR